MPRHKRSLTGLVSASVATLLCAATLPLSQSFAAPAPPTCLEDTRTAYAGKPTYTGATSAPAAWSADGRYVVDSAQMISGLTDTNSNISDAVWRDRTTGDLEIVSLDNSGAQLNDDATALQVSDDGRYVLFRSAGAFVAGDTNTTFDVFVRDRQLATTLRVDVGSGGTEIPAGSSNATMSADGRYFVFTTDAALDVADTNGVADVYRYDSQTDTTAIVSVYDDETPMPLASAQLGVDSSGNVVYFSTDSAVPGSSDPVSKVVRDMVAGTTTLVPVDEAFLTRPGTSLVVNTAASHSGADGNAFVDAYLYDIATTTWTLITDRTIGLPTGIDVVAHSASTSVRYVDVTFDDGHDASVVVDRTGASFRYASSEPGLVSDDGTELITGALVSAVGLPVVYSVAPTSIVRSSSVPVTVTGREFVAGTTFDFGSGLTVTDLVLSGDQATLTLTASAGATLGAHTVQAIQASGCRASLTSAITVNTAPPVFPAPSVSEIEPALIRPNTNTPIQISGSNFQAGAIASSTLPVSGSNFQSSSSMTATLDSTGAAESIIPLTVTNPDTKANTLSEAMLVRSSRGEFHSLGPVRILDTRSTSPIGANSTRDVQVTGVGGVPSNGVKAVLMNVTVAGPTATSYLTIFPKGTPQPNSSSLNFVAGQAVPNLVTATVGANGQVTVYNFAGSTHVLFDVVGWYSDVGTTYGGTFVGLTPTRALDTRFDLPQPLGRNEYISLPIVVPGSPISAVMMNVTVTAPTAGSYLTIWPGGSPLPNASSLNFVPGQTVPNLVVAPVGSDGSVNIYNFAGETQVIVDVVGLFENGTIAVVDGQYEAVQPFRALDTRSAPRINGQPAPISAGESITLDVRTIGVPDDASVLMMNVTSVGSTAGGFVTVYPGDEARPNTSNLNFSAGQTVPNAVAMRIGADRKIKFYNETGSTHLIIDVTGWYRPGYPVGAFYDPTSIIASSTPDASGVGGRQWQSQAADWLAVDRLRSVVRR